MEHLQPRTQTWPDGEPLAAVVRRQDALGRWVRWVFHRDADGRWIAVSHAPDSGEGRQTREIGDRNGRA